MKTVSSLKHLFVVLLVAISITACKKDKDKDMPAPDLVTRVSGTYVLSELGFNGKTIPAEKSDLKGDMKVSKFSEKSITLFLNIRSKSTNEVFLVFDGDDILLSEDAEVTALVYVGERIGKIQGNKITINGTDEEGVDFTLTATR